jgi:hypothetical protein
MKISLVILSFALFASVLSQDCNNPLLSAYNLTALDQPQSGQGLQWCSNLQSGQTCCSNDTVNQLQGLLQDLIDSLENETAARDQGLVGLRNNLIDSYQDAVSDLTDNDDQLNNLNNSNSAVGNEIRTQWSQFRNITEDLSDLDDDDLNDRDNDPNDNTDDDNDFFLYLQNLQVARSSCLNALVGVQASLWCLACDANWASQGVDSNGTVTLSDDAVSSLTQSCYNYTLWSQVFNPLLIANQTIQRVRNLNDYLRNYRNDNSVLQNNNITNDVYQPVNANEKTVVLPSNCSNTSCPWQTLLLLSGGSINQEIAANGAGVVGGADAFLADIIQGNVVPANVTPVSVDDLLNNGSITIVVQNGSNVTAWTPANNQSGLPINVSGDPGQVSGLQEGVLPAGVAGAAAGGAAGAIAVANGQNDNTDNDGINTDVNDPTDNDGINTDVNDPTDNDGINTDVNDPTDNDGINTDANDPTDNDGVNTDANDPTDNNSDNN